MEKRTKRLVTMGILAAMAAVLVSGCGGKKKATPENLLRDMTRRMGDMESVLMDIKFEMDMSDGEQTVSFGLDMDMETTVDPEASHAKGEFNFDLAGFTIGTEMELYSVKEDDQYVTYTMVENQWTKEVSDAEDPLGNVENMTGDIREFADRFELEEDLAEINGEECFELTGELDGDIIGEMFQDDMLDAFSEYGIDEDTVIDMALPCTIYIYRESILPARISFDLADTLETALEESGLAASDCLIEITFVEFDSVDEITVPKEALDAEESGILEDFEAGAGSVKPTEPAEQSAELGSVWNSYTVQINDTVVTLPCTIADLEAAGVTLDSESTPADYIVNAGEYETAWFLSDSGDEIMVDMINNTGEAKKLKDCLVGGIYVYSYNLEAGGLTVVFPGGIQIGSAGADVIAAYGEPDDTYEDDEYGNSYYWYDMDSYSNMCSIDTEAGTDLVQSMSLSCEE